MRHVLPRVDTIIGGSPCFPAGTLIDTPDGHRPIESIRIGDLVATHEKRYRAVVQTMQRSDAPLIEVKAMGTLPILATPEHPFYARRRSTVWNNERRRYDRVFSAPEWVDASALTRDHYVAQPMSDEPIAREWESPEFWYVVGRWLGDGWIVDGQRKSKIPQGNRGSRVNSRWHKAMICCAHKESDVLGEKIKSAGFRAYKNAERTASRFCISSAEFVRFLAPFGRGAAGKRVPGFVFGAPRSVLSALWQGWLESDGHRFANGNLTFTTISRDLAIGMARVGRIVTQNPVGLYRQEVPSTTVIEGRTVRQSTQYSVHVHAQRHEGFCENGHCWVPVRSVRSVAERSDVFNFEVADDNSYVAGGLVVHNCQDLSLAGKRAGFDGAKSSLWREYLRIVDQLRPRFMLLENVPGLYSSNGGWDFAEVLGGLAALGYDATWDLFRASDVGAPQRRERIFLLAYRDDGGGEGSDSRGERAREHGIVRDGADRMANAEQREGGQRHHADVLGRRAREAEQTRVGGGGRTGDVAHGNPLRQLQPQGSECHIGRRSGDGGESGHELVDARSVDVQRLGRPGDVPNSTSDPQSEAHERQWRGDSACGASEGIGMVDPDRARREARDVSSRGTESEHGRSRSAVGGEQGGAVEPCMGWNFNGLPCGLVRPSVADAGPSQGIDAHRWPVGRGQPQAPHEPPRTAHGVVNRSHALRAYGNAVVPQVASLAWRTLFARIVESTRRR